jgi:hypothetical protein
MTLPTPAQFLDARLVCVDEVDGKFETIDYASCIDLDHVEAVTQSHMGEEYTVLFMSSGEKITVKKNINEVRAAFVRKNYGRMGEM